MHKRVLALASVAVLAFAACGGGGSSPGDAQPPAETIGQVVSSSLKATQSGFTYSIQTFLPASYAKVRQRNVVVSGGSKSRRRSAAQSIRPNAVPIRLGNASA